MTTFFVLSNYVVNCLNKVTRRIVAIVFNGKGVYETSTEEKNRISDKKKQKAKGEKVN